MLVKVFLRIIIVDEDLFDFVFGVFVISDIEGTFYYAEKSGIPAKYREIILLIGNIFQFLEKQVPFQ